MTRFWFLPLALLLGCQKDPTAPVDRLPPATQTGANTFGCLVNGRPWTPQGYNGTSNYSTSYDPGLNGGLFDLSAYRYTPGSPDQQAIVLYANQAGQVGQYSLRSPQRTRASYSDSQTNCYWSSRDSATTYRRGTLTLTRLDLNAGIVSGTFAYTLYKSGCDSVRVTQGRFDKRL